MHYKLHELFDLLNIEVESAVATCSGGHCIESAFDLCPEDFIEQAEEDFEAGGTRAILDAIGNARRAIRCGIDKSLLGTGFDLKDMPFRRKIALLGDLGFVAPRIIRRVSEKRNLLEHEYKRPTIDEVEESLDLAVLFVEALNRTKSFLVYGHKGLSCEHDPQRKEKFVGQSKISRDGSTFVSVMRLAIAIDKDRAKKTERAVAQLLESIDQIRSASTPSKVCSKLQIASRK
jgi:hypothetical protein